MIADSDHKNYVQKYPWPIIMYYIVFMCRYIYNKSPKKFNIT